MFQMKFFLFFLTQCGPLICTVMIGAVAWTAIRFLIQSRGMSSRRFSREQSLWSNWT